MIDVSSVASSLAFSEIVTVRRTSGSFNSFGQWVESTQEDSSVVGIWLAVTERELAQLGVGDIQGEIRKLITTAEIICNLADTNSSDRIIHPASGRRYRVIKVTDNNNFGFYRAFAVFEGTEA